MIVGLLITGIIIAILLIIVIFILWFGSQTLIDNQFVQYKNQRTIIDLITLKSS